MNSFLAEQSGRFGVADLKLNTPYDVSLALKGTPSEPVFSARAELDSGQLRLEPESALLPRGNIKLGRVDVSWDTASSAPHGCIVVEDGTLEHKGMGLKAEQLSGTLCIDNNAIVLEPFTAVFTGNPMSGKLHYDLATESADFEINGSVAKLESTPLHNVSTR